MLLIWLFPLIAGLADAGLRHFIKQTKTSSFVLLGVSYLFALPAYLIWLMLGDGIPTIGPDFWPSIAIHVPLMILALWLTVIAHRQTPITLTVPYQALTPAFLLFTSPIMGGGRPSLWGIIGVIIITSGIYTLNLQKSHLSLSASIKNLWSNHGSKLIIAVAFIHSITANLDNTALLNASSPFYLLIDHGILGIAFLIMAWIESKSAPEKYSSGFLPDGIRPLIWMGVVIVASVIPHMLALQWIANVPYVIAGKRAGSIFFAVGAALWFASSKKYNKEYAEEKKHLAFRLVGTFVITIGMLIIIFAG